MRVVCLRSEDGGRSRHVAEALADGFRRHGHDVVTSLGFNGAVEGDLVAAYGWRFADAFNAYQRAGARYVYVDMGFWNRKPLTAPRDGHHKVVLDSWCPTLRMHRGCPGDRFRALGVKVETPRTDGQSIVIAGMSSKSAADHGFAPDQWETAAVRELAYLTQRPLIYKAKPSWQGAKAIAGAAFVEGRKPIAELLASAHMLVTHHSNAAVDAVVAGVPMYCAKGVGSLLSTAALTDIEAPRRPADGLRQAFLNDVAYIQWTPTEMRSGACWDHMKGQL